jgi:hypothetical protein
MPQRIRYVSAQWNRRRWRSAAPGRAVRAAAYLATASAVLFAAVAGREGSGVIGPRFGRWSAWSVEWIFAQSPRDPVYFPVWSLTVGQSGWVAHVHCHMTRRSRPLPRLTLRQPPVAP